MDEPHNCVGVTGPTYTTDQCRPCWLVKYGADLKARRARVRPGVIATDRSLPCLHLGDPTGEFRACRSCQIDPPTTAQVRVCMRHGECTVERPAVRTAACCKHCPDHRPKPSADGRRHLAFHVLPVRGPGVWRRALDQLRLRWPLFTGRKVVAVMTGAAGDHLLDPPDEVAAHLPPDAEVVAVPNDPALREVASWAPLWERVLAAAGPGDVALYAHAKGVTRNVDPGNSCQWWASLLYSLYLDHWPLVADLLARHPIAGAFKKVGRGFQGSESQWHYSGSFFWARLDDFRARPWRRIDRLWWGTESWPGTAYHADEAGAVFLTGKVPTLDLYSPAFWASVVRPEYSRWLERNRPAWPWLEVARG